MNIPVRLVVVAATILYGCTDDGESTTPASVQSAQNLPIGAQVYERWCLPCHAAGPGHPGTNRLAERLGVENSVILERSGLTADYVKVIVRNGFQMMPPFRITEISERELDAVAAYVASNGGQAVN